MRTPQVHGWQSEGWTCPDEWLWTERSDAHTAAARQGNTRAVVYAHTRQHAFLPTEGPHTLAQLSRQTRVIAAQSVTKAGHPAVTVTEATLKRGTARSGKTWARWRVDRSTKVVARPGEPWLVTHLDANRYWTTRHAFSTARHPHPPHLPEIVGLLLPRPVALGDYYPLLAHYADSSGADPANLHGAHWAITDIKRAFAHTTSAPELTRKLFGVTRYRRDLVRAVATASINHLSLAWQFRGLTPVDWIITLLNAPDPRDSRPYNRSIRPVLRALDRTSLRRLTGQPLPPPRLMDDIHRMGAAGLDRCRDWQDLHDQQVAVLNRRKIEARDTPVKTDELMEALDGPIRSGEDHSLRFEVARTETRLLEWGQQMRHCIGSYGYALRSGAILAGVYRGDQLLGNAHIPRPCGSAPYLNQLLGRHNSPLDPPIARAVEGHLTEHGIDIPDNYWGRELRNNHNHVA